MTTRIVRLDAGTSRTFTKSDVVLKDGQAYFAARLAESDGPFRLLLAGGGEAHGYSPSHPEPQTSIYVPLHDSVTAETIMGANYSYDDGTHWLLAACSPDEQVDFAADARTFALEQYNLAIQSAQLKVSEATHARLKGERVAKVKALLKFAEAVGDDVFQTVLGAVLGHYHKNEHHDHRRELALASNDKISAAWKIAGLTDKAVKDEHDEISSTAAAVRTALSRTHTPEWPHEREARLAEEAKKKAGAEAETSTQSPSETPSGD